MRYVYYLLGLMLLVTVNSTSVYAQVSNDNEDGVYKVQKHQQNDFVPGQVLFKLKDGHQANVRRAAGRVQSAGISSLDAVLNEYEVEEMEQLLPNAKVAGTPRRAKAFNGTTIVEHDLTQLYKITLSEEKLHNTMQLVEQLNALPEVEFAEPNYRLYALEGATIDGFSGGNPFAASQWYLESYGVTSLWNKPIINSKRPVIAILDTGVDITHPDLVDNIWTNAGEYQGEKGYDNDNNGFKNDLHGWDFINNTPNIRDFNMHGTHVAGIAAASNNGIGIVGANPKALIMPVTIMQSDGTGDVATIIKGINYAVANGATILNMSLGTYANTRALRQALENAYQKAVIVAAAGNDGMQILPVCKPREPYGPMFPAAYSFVLGVMATNQEGNLAGFSNYDCDGPNFSSTSTLQDPDGFNYELKAPGTAMYSTLPGGKYGNLNGTSMSTPLVAGAISALKMVKQYDTQEILWGDLLHTDNIAQAYALTRRPAELDLIKVMYRERKELSEETEEDYSGDGRIDAGETISLYPVIRTTFGAASNIKMHLEMGDQYEDPNTVQILTGVVNFGQPLSAYGKGVSLNPLQLKVAENVANGRHIKMKFVATCDETNVTYEGHFTMIVDNVTKISGFINEDVTLTANHIYMVPKSLGVPEGKTLTIEPGTTLLFAPDVSLSCSGTLIAIGTPEKPIRFTCSDGNSYWGAIHAKETIKYCIIERSYQYQYDSTISPMEDCIVDGQSFNFNPLSNIYMDRCNYINTFSGFAPYSGKSSSVKHSNIVNNLWGYNDNLGSQIDDRIFFNSNIVNTYWKWYEYNPYKEKFYTLGYNSTTPIEHTISPVYLGSSKEEIIRSSLFEIGNTTGKRETFAHINLDNLLQSPNTEAHGIVWKVCVNGKDAQDEYEDLAPLGVGRHKFEVYFNRPMNKAVAPQITFGVRDPWTQNAVAEDGSWNEEGTIYTAYKTINGRTKSDGINRIYVRGAEDNEYFEIPYEKTRFNVMINAAGSMATGFAAEPGMGRVNLTWDNTHNNFEDAMGFNVYRYTEGNESNPTRLNEEIIDVEATSYTDYNVTPGTTYYYYYKVLSTDLKEYDVSNVVTSTPLTASRGDANGDGNVNVMDVTSAVDYIVGQNPKPFVFEAADMNTDLSIDVLDVVGIVNKILNPSTASISAFENAQEAIYTVEDGMLYIETPVALAGLQLQFYVNDGKRLKTASSLKEFERVTTWLSENDYQILVFNIGDLQLTPGKHEIVNIGDAEITSIRLSDRQGSLVRAIAGQGTTAIKDAMGSKVQNVKGVYNLNGQKLTDSSKLQRGVYIINGKKIVK